MITFVITCTYKDNDDLRVSMIKAFIGGRVISI